MFFTSAASAVVLEHMREGHKKKQSDDGGNRLSIREREVVQLLAEDKSNKEIGASLHISKRTVDHHRANIMDKLHLQSVGELVGRVVRGAHELSGCAGWVTISLDGNTSSSVTGELESMTAGPGLASAARNRLQAGEASSLTQFDVSKITAHEVAAAAREGDQLALDVFQRAGRLLGFGVANMVSLFDPEIVIIGGGMAGAADLYLDSLRAAMLQRAQPLAARQVKVVVSKLGDRANLFGCVRLAWQSLAIRKSRMERR